MRTSLASAGLFFGRESVRLDPAQLRPPMGKDRTLVDIGDKLRCRRCSNGFYNGLTVLRLPRNVSWEGAP